MPGRSVSAHGMFVPSASARSSDTARVERIRLAETLAALSLAGDLGHGQTLEHSLRVTYLASILAERVQLGPAERREAFYVGLLQATGCVGNAHDTSALLHADDIAFKHAIVRANFEGPAAQLRAVVRIAGTAGSAARRPAALAAALSRPDAPRMMARQHCQVAALIARRAGLGEGVERGLRALFERWDGRGAPDGQRGPGIPLATRLVQIGVAIDVANADGGPDAAQALVAAASGAALDPELAGACLELLRTRPPWDALGTPSLWEDVLAREPAAARVLLAVEELDTIARAFADFADLKSPWFVGHSRGVASLAEGAARALHLSTDESTFIRRAALFHDVGRATVPNTVLDKPGPLTPGERERVRLHAYYTERVLERSAGLAPYATVASAHHERLDGSGYPRRATLGGLSVGARILAGADVLQALTEERPYRRAATLERAVAQLRGEGRAGRLDPEVIEAVVIASGAAPLGRVRASGLLSDREIEVVRLLSGGHSNKEIARRLGISPNTARHHLESLYAKLDVSTRTGAVMAALERGLL